jgi:diguanylate cyclase (GGDEF)-like protein
MFVAARVPSDQSGWRGWRGLQALLSPPPSSGSADPRLYRSFVVLHLVGPLFGLPICTALLLLEAEAGAVPLLFTAGVCLFWLLPFLARRGLERAAFLSVQLLTSVSLFGAFFYGGLNSPFAVWLIVAVLLGFLYVPSAMIWCAGAMAAQGGVFLLAQQAFAPAPRLDHAALGMLFLASSMAAALYVSLIAAFYSRIKTERSELGKIAARYDDTAARISETIARLEADNEQASEFMAQASHELRTALDVVIGYSDLLLEDAGLDEREVDQHRLARITASSRQMLALVADGDRLAEAGSNPEAARGASDELRAAELPAHSLDPVFRLPLGVRLRAASSSLPWRMLFAAAGTGFLAHAVSGSPLLALATVLLALSASALGRRPSRAAAAPDIDALTGLVNRAAFQRELEARLASSSGTEIALLFADLDGFKEVNDSLGHDVGDQLLARVAERFVAVCPPGAILARLGGDEFGAAIFGPGAESAIRQFAEAMLDTLLEPVPTDEHHLTIGISIGLANGHSGQISGRELLRRSDVAMYRAKHDKRTPIQAFDVQMDEALNFRRTMRLDLAEALSGGELELHLQPVVDARSGDIGSVEALLRWSHPVLGPISPAKLIALAEESGQIVAIDDWVLDRALGHAKRLRTLPVAINISPVQFRHPSFARKIVDRLEAHAVPPQLLRLEITEGVLVTHTRAAARAIADLREAGVKVALDDFGTGFSSLSYLKDFGFDLLKVDRSFITALDKGRQGAELLRAIVDLGHSLSMSVIAEGVETSEQAALVQLLGCDFIQGYFTGRPMPLDQLEAWLREAAAPAPGTFRTSAAG